ncbi:MAG TPA: FAD-dependent oxidoreductase [Herpetosiphonaceae bacterium]
MAVSPLPVVVIGAGPVGLSAAAHLIERGATPLVLEAGAEIAASMREWGHVRLFSPWAFNLDPASVRLLEAAGWQAPDATVYPTGQAIVDQYLSPLAALPALAPHIRTSARVVAISRQGFDKMKTPGRDQAPFLVRFETPAGEETVLAQAVIDASGTYQSPNPLAASGLPAPGERAAADRIFYGIPDALGRHRDRYAGKTVLVVGSGHSAFNALLDLAELAGAAPATRLLWAVRKNDMRPVYGGGANDELAARGELGQRIRQLVERGAINLVTGFRLDRIAADGDRLLVGGGEDAMHGVDEIIAVTGFRPDLSLASELRLDLDPAVESPRVLAPLIDPNLHSCGTVRPHGAAELAHPEAGFYIVGMKSYGRAPTFLLRTGYEQARSVVAALCGDHVAAADVQLVLPETGVCSTSFGAGDSGGSCCGAPVAVPAGTISLTDAIPLSAGGACCG